MKKILLFTISFLIAHFSFSQDNMVLKNGDEIISKVLEIGEIYVKYKKFNNQDGPIYTIKKDKILLITYTDGEKEIFSKDKRVFSKVKVKETLDSSEIKQKQILFSGYSSFNFSNTFENDDFYSSSQINFALLFGGYFLNNFAAGCAISIESYSVNAPGNMGYKQDNSTIGPFIRGYMENFYSQISYQVSEDVNTFLTGFGFQIHLNDNESVSFNPTFTYFTNYYDLDPSYDIYGDVINSGGPANQSGIRIGGSFEIHL